MKTCVFVLIVAGVLLAAPGCRKKQLQPGVIVADKQVALAEMAPGDVIVSVNGKALTRQAYDDRLDVQTMLYSIRKPSANKQSIDLYRSSRAAKAIPEYVTMQLVLQEGQRQGIRLSPEALAAAERKVWQGVAPHKMGDDFAAALGPKTPLFKQIVADDEYVKVTRNTLFADRLEVSEADVDAAEKRRAEWNAVYAESNRVVMARGGEIVRELRDGADFAETAKQVSQFRPEEGGVWGEFTHAEIEDKKIRELAFTLPVGAISDPVDTEDGLVIIRVLERTDGAAVDLPIATQVATVKLARILLLMYNPFDELDRDGIRAAIQRDKNIKLQQEWLPKLMEAARIESPTGTNLWPKAKSQPRRGIQ